MEGTGNRQKQRKRLLGAIVHVSAERGYEDTTIAQVIARAELSRSTFYEHFSSKEECSLAALAGLQARVLAEVADSIRVRPPKDAAPATIVALLALAERYPGEVRFLTHEALAAGPRALDAHDRGIERIAALIERAHKNVKEAAPISTLPGEILIGAAYRVLAAHLRPDETGLLPALREDLLGWVAAYAEPARVRRWHTLARSRAPRVEFVGRAPLRSTPAASTGHSRRSLPAIAERQRQRIVFATAEIVQQGGYAAATVAQITRAAGVDGRVFYRLFAGKQDAFKAVHELAFQETMAVTAGAFFTAESWPRRIWQAGEAFTRYLEQNPALTHASLIDAHAGGREAVKRLQELVAGFTIFLQEGYEHRLAGHGGPPSALALEAIAQAAFEILYRQARTGTGIAGQLPQLAYVCLAPFMGPAGAGELIEELTRTANPR